MRKLLFAALIITAISLSGCGGEPYGTGESEAEQATVTTETAATTTTTTIPVTTTTASTAKRALMGVQEQITTTEATSIMADKTIALNVETQRGEGVLTFKAVKLVSEYNRARFYYSTQDKSVVLADGSKTVLIGKSGKSYSYEGGGQLMSEEYGCSQDIAFNGITDFFDLSHVKIVYQFEGFDPVEVEFDIPGV